MALVVLQMQLRPTSCMRFSAPCYLRTQVTEAFRLLAKYRPRRVGTEAESMDNEGALNL